MKSFNRNLYSESRAKYACSLSVEVGLNYVIIFFRDGRDDYQTIFGLSFAVSCANRLEDDAKLRGLGFRFLIIARRESIPAEDVI